MKLNNWRIFRVNGALRMSGEAEGWPGTAEGAEVMTSPIKGLLPDDDVVVTLDGDTILLGDPHPDAIRRAVARMLTLAGVTE